MQYQTENQYQYQEAKKGSLVSNARLAFIKKVYSLLSVQLLVTFFMICLSNSSKSFLRFQHNNMWLAYLSMGVSVVTCIALAFASLSKKVPVNYCILGAFTAAEAYLVSFICTMYETKSVLFCGALTLGVTLGLTLHAMTTTKDYSAMMGAVYGMFFILVTISLLNFFIRSTFMNNALALGFAVIYLVYILIDTQLIIGKSNNRKLSLDDYIMGTMMLYIDIVGLFLKLLELFGERRRNKD